MLLIVLAQDMHDQIAGSLIDEAQGIGKCGNTVLLSGTTFEPD